MRQTPLHDAHVALGAKMVDYAGWRMPVQYGSILDEVRTVRERAGIFDLMHMGRLVVSGPEHVALLDRVVTSFVARIRVGASRYGLVCDEDGGPLDDVLLYRDEDDVLVVANAANTPAIVDWLRRHAEGMDASVEDRTETMGMVALQGQVSQEILEPLVEGTSLADLKYFRWAWCSACGVDGVRISRTGYTGEDGFELYFPAERAEHVWGTLLDAGRDAGLAPIGLGARDTLRLEAGMPLYGHEIDREHDPIEAGLSFGVSFHEEKGDWIGRDALAASKANPKRKLVGLTTDGKRAPRQGYPLFDGDREVGAICSGAVSPTLGTNIGTAYVPLELAEAGTRLEMDIRGKRQPCVVADLPFFSRTRK